LAINCPKCHFDNPEDTRFCGNCAAPLHPLKDISVSQTETLKTPIKELTTGSTFAGRYQVIEELGKGGMGRVYKVFDTDIKEKVALKLLKPEIASDRETIERFSNELKYARKISQRNVCRMYDLGKAEGTHFITMEYVHGEDLKSMIRMSIGLTVGTVLSIGKQVCDGLAEAHSLGVVHRDLKPQNIMIDKGGNAKIMDFGIARSIREKGITGPSVMIGTPEYMSPEQAEAEEVDHRSDIYSLGIILYEMVTGRVPFEGDTALSIAMKHKGESPKNPKQFNPNIPDDLSGVILKCLEKDKAKRYQTAAEVRSELEKIEKGIPTTDRIVPKRKPPTSREITVKFSLKKLLIPGLVVAALVIAAVIIIWRIIPQKEAAPAKSGKPSIAVLYFENNTGDQSLEHWRKALADLLTTDLLQSKYLRVLTGDMLSSLLSELGQVEARHFSSTVIEKLSDKAGLDFVVRGSYAKSGSAIRIDAVLQKTSTGEAIAAERVEAASEAQIFPVVDELTRRIKKSLPLTATELATDIDNELGKITTSSPAAYRLFSEGIRANWRGDYDQSLQLLREAVAIDPLFASAYRVMGNVLGRLGLPSQAKINMEKAAELSDRTSDRERLLILGDFYRSSSDKTYDKAIEAYGELLRLYPDDHIVNTNLGIVYFDLEEWDKALERFGVGYKTWTRYQYLSATYMALGQHDKLPEVLSEYLSSSPNSGLPHYLLAQTYLCQGKLDQASVEIDEALALGPTNNDFIETRGDVYQYHGDFSKAEEEYQKLIQAFDQVAQLYGLLKLQGLQLLGGRFGRAEEIGSQGVELAREIDQSELEYMFHLVRAWIYINRLKSDEALRECDAAWRIGVESGRLVFQARAMHIRGIACVLANSPKSAEQAADEIRKISRTRFHEKENRRSYHLAGWMEQKKNNLPEAIKLFEQAKSLLPSQYYVPNSVRVQSPQSYEHAFYLEPLAAAYYRAGQLEKAKKQYEEITTLTVGRVYFGDLYAKSLYMLGKINDEMDRKAEALEYYQKFLDLWKDADPGQPEVEDARKRIAGLKGR